MPELHNHTPHPVVLLLEGREPVELPARTPTPHCPVTRTTDGTLDTTHGPVPLTRTTLADHVVDLPPLTPGVLFIVARTVAEACPDRSDLLFPDDLVRDEHGRVVGCRALGRAVAAT